MKTFFGIFALVLLFACGSNTVIYPDKPKTNHETFSYKEGDTTYVMQKYFLVMLKKGPNREHSKEEAAEIQKKHMEHINWLAKTNKISIAGPSDKHETISGFLLFYRKKR